MAIKKERIFAIFKIVIPLLLIAYIFSRIDFENIISIIVNSQIDYLLIAGLSVPIQYLLFTIRWKILLNILESKKLSFLDLHSTLYEGLFIGFFVPGGIGIDIYRIIKIKYKYNFYLANISITILEKIIGIISSIVLFLVIYPFIGIQNDTLRQIIIFGLFTLIIVFGIIFFFSITKRIVGIRIIEGIDKFLHKQIISILKRLRKNKKEIAFDKKGIRQIVNSFLNIKSIFIVFFFSITILIVKSFFMNLVFIGFGYNISFIANLFVVPLLNIISLIPVSFGGVGVRDTGFIILYGFFGVPAEASLLVSILTFTYLLLNILFGGVLMILKPTKTKAKDYKIIETDKR